jgi:hypothetical protein
MRRALDARAARLLHALPLRAISNVPAPDFLAALALGNQRWPLQCWSGG